MRNLIRKLRMLDEKKAAFGDLPRGYNGCYVSGSGYQRYRRIPLLRWWQNWQYVTTLINQNL